MDEASAQTHRLINLAYALSEQFEETGSEATLAAAIEAARAADRAAPAEGYDMAAARSALGNVLLSQFERHRDLADLDAAANAFAEAAAALPDDHPDRLGLLINLGMARWRRFEETADIETLDDAITSLRTARAGLAVDHPYLVMCLENLGNALHSRFERTNRLEDLAEAVDVLSEGLRLTPLNDRERPAHLSNLAVARQSRYERLNYPDDADLAIDGLTQAVALTPRGPHRATYLANLAGALRVRFQATGREDDLDRAVELLSEAVATTPHATFLDGLGSALTVRFRRYGEQADGDAAVDAARQAVAMTSSGHPDLAGRQANLSVATRDRFLRTRYRPDIDDAVAAGQVAVDATPADHPDGATYRTNLGNALRSRYDHHGSAADLDAAVDALDESVAATPVDHPYRPARLSNLGAALRARHADRGASADLDLAVARLREAAVTIATDHPDRAGILHNLGRALKTLFGLTHDRVHADEALTCDQQASRLVTAPPEIRLTAAKAWARFARDTGDTRSAADGYAAAVALLPIAAWHGLERATRQVQLVENEGLATEAVVTVLEAGELTRAVELLEQARSVLWTQALHLRSDLDDLSVQNPDLAVRLDRARHELGRQTVEGDALVPQRHRQLAAEWDDLVRRARLVPGFQDFLMPTPFARLREAAVGGPVILLIAGQQCGYAVVVTTAGVDLVKLPRLTFDTAVAQANLLLTATSRGHTRDLAPPSAAARHELPSEVLAWLWDAAAEPVLDHLGGPRRQHLWWSLVGPLAMLPIHAAGRYARTDDSVPARVVSSYTPSLTSLLRARSSTSGTTRQLVVAMSRTPRLPPLPAVGREQAVISAYLPGLHLENEGATREAVLRALASHPWVHFACHGSQSETDPASSAFMLWDGPLTLDDLAGVLVEQADLAFLSACQTAMGSSMLVDEALHLVAAMQLLGYRHVIGTLWTIADAAAPEVAETVYRSLAAGNHDLAYTAEAVHEAVEQLRARHPDQPLLWAPYVHFGP